MSSDTFQAAALDDTGLDLMAIGSGRRLADPDSGVSGADACNGLAFEMVEYQVAWFAGGGTEFACHHDGHLGDDSQLCQVMLHLVNLATRPTDSTYQLTRSAFAVADRTRLRHAAGSFLEFYVCCVKLAGQIFDP